MLLSLMVYVITVSLLLALAAWAFERAVHVFAFPTRWIWVGAMAGSVVLTMAVATVFVRAQLRLRSDRSTWTPAGLDGRDVLVSEDLGPGVVGWIRSVDVKRYARLLVEIGARGTAARLSALAFSRPIPSIERRILAMTDTRDPRYVRMAGLILLSALLVAVSCEVERPPTDVPEASVVPADPPVVRVEPPTTQGEPAASGVESIEDAIRTLRALDPAGGPIVRGTDQAGDVAPSQAEPQEISPEDRTAIQSGPSLMPMTIRPEIRNRTEVQGALMREYPVTLRDSGIGGTVVLWLYLSDEGVVLDRRLSRSSGQAQLDEAALRVATTLRFTPAVRRTEPVAVWIEVPITFQVR